MASYKSIFISYLQDEGIRYIDQNEHFVRVPYSGENLKSIPMLVRFDNNNEPRVRILCAEIANFKGKENIGIALCNELNNDYRWLKFYLDKNSELIAALDTYIDENTCGFCCLDLVRRSVTIIDEVYPRIARAMWA